ncbi:MAG TPA: hypothetical protein VNQ74_13450 [Burkholderiaceae bacterium]|nr:hypothetical protein [Burkholderiaceae bacterium]
MRGSTYWTQQEDDELWRLHSQGVSMIRLSVRFKRTRRAVEVRLMGLRKRQCLIGTNAERSSPDSGEAEHV